MMGPDPRLDSPPQFRGEFNHSGKLSVRHDLGPFVVSKIALLAKQIQHPDAVLVESDREFERLERPVVVVRPLHSVSGGSQCCCRRLESRVVGDVEAPVAHQVRRLAGLKIAVGEREECGNFLHACLVRNHPPVVEPIS